jgi:prophage regulatory protein
MSRPLKLVGLTEIAQEFGVSRQRVLQLAEREHFPAPVAELRQGRVWRAADIKQRAAKHRPPSISR